MDSKYKEDHELFVSNVNGTTALEVLLATVVTTISILIVRTSPTILTNWWCNSLGQCFFIIFPSILAFTVLSSYLLPLVFTLLFLVLFGKFLRQKLCKEEETTLNRRFESQKVTFLSEFRSHLLLDTLICILGVDFPAFPRRFAKTETFGWGLMDVGVGAFVVSAGLVAYDTRQPEPTKLKQCQNLLKTVVSSSALIILGLFRVLLVKQVNYHEHITEYGVHWNFFLTLGFTRVFCSFIYGFVPVRYSLHCSLLLILLYQYALLNLGLTEFIFNEHRRNILEANKEGLISLIGYASSYFAAVHIGQTIMHNKNNTTKLLMQLLLGGILCYILMNLSSIYLQPVSRRMFNLSFYLWVIAFSCLHLAFHLVVDILLNGQMQCAVLVAINKNGLLFFLIGNVLTGIINLSIKTISSSKSEAIMIIMLYMLVPSTIVLAISRYKGTV